MHAVIETPAYLAAAKSSGLSDPERAAIVDLVASNPEIGDRIVGTGGARKFRFAGRGKGKSGGYRIVSFYAAEDIPVFLITVFGKNERDNLTKAERNLLGESLKRVASEYRNTHLNKGAGR